MNSNKFTLVSTVLEEYIIKFILIQLFLRKTFLMTWRLKILKLLCLWPNWSPWLIKWLLPLESRVDLHCQLPLFSWSTGLNLCFLGPLVLKIENANAIYEKNLHAMKVEKAEPTFPFEASKSHAHTTSTHATGLMGTKNSMHHFKKQHI